MTERENAYLRYQQARWMRPDAHLWIRPDAARFLKPGTDPASVYPALEQKYRADQPRVPAGNPDGGQWTNGGGGHNAGRVTANPMGAVNADPGETGNLGLFEIAPREQYNSGYAQLAGEVPTSDTPGIGHNDGPEFPLDEPPEIPQQKPKTSAERTAFMRAAASWLSRNTGLAGNIYVVAMSNVEWLKERQDLILAARDGPKIYEQLQEGVGKQRRGYDDHHVVEQTWAEYFGFARSQIDDPSNLVSIPRLKHYQITGWYGAKNRQFGGLSPREYLSDKSWEERVRVGREAMILFKVLKP